MSKRWLLLTAVFLLSFAILSFRIENCGIASTWVDPVGKIGAQDEAVYSAIAIGMARDGEWLTPRFLGRFALFKPPLLYWLSGASVKLFGASNFGLRLPSLIAGSLAATLVFAWLLPAGPLPALFALLLALSNPMLVGLSRLNLMDALLALLLSLAAWALHRDPTLARASTRWSFAILAAAAMMTKAVAGALCLLLLFLYWLCARGATRPALRRVVEVAALAVLLAAPWHLYQLAAHPVWFWSEYIVDEHFRSALHPLHQTSNENHAWFYLKRWALIDPVLLLCSALALPGFLRAVRRRESGALVLFCWIAAVGAAVLLFSYRNAAYLLPAMLACAIAAAAYAPVRSRAAMAFGVALLSAGFVWKLSHPAEPWGLSYPRAAAAVPSAHALERYAALQRPNELIIVMPDDEFYATLLPIRKVRYSFVDDGRHGQRPAMDFRRLGIAVSVDEFLDLARCRPAYLERLREFGLASGEPIATVIEMEADSEFARLMAGSPHADFFVPARFLSFATPGHSTRAAGDRLFLLADQ